jgi:hypothetical protein
MSGPIYVRFLSVKVSRKLPKGTNCAERSRTLCLGLVGWCCTAWALSFPYEPEGRGVQIPLATNLLIRLAESQHTENSKLGEAPWFLIAHCWLSHCADCEVRRGVRRKPLVSTARM